MVGRWRVLANIELERAIGDVSILPSFTEASASVFRLEQAVILFNIVGMSKPELELIEMNRIRMLLEKTTGNLQWMIDMMPDGREQLLQRSLRRTVAAAKRCTGVWSGETSGGLGPSLGPAVSAKAASTNLGKRRIQAPDELPRSSVSNTHPQRKTDASFEATPQIPSPSSPCVVHLSSGEERAPSSEIPAGVKRSAKCPGEQEEAGTASAPEVNKHHAHCESRAACGDSPCMSYDDLKKLYEIRSKVQEEYSLEWHALWPRKAREACQNLLTKEVLERERSDSRFPWSRFGGYGLVTLFFAFGNVDEEFVVSFNDVWKRSKENTGREEPQRERRVVGAQSPNASKYVDPRRADTNEINDDEWTTRRGKTNKEQKTKDTAANSNLLTRAFEEFAEAKGLPCLKEKPPSQAIGEKRCSCF